MTLLEFRSGPRCPSCCWQLSAWLCWRPFASRPPHPITSHCPHPLCHPLLQRRMEGSRPCAEPNVPWATQEPPRWMSWSCLDGAREHQAAARFAGRRGWVWVCGGLAPAPPHLGVPDSFPLRGAESREVTPGARSASRALLSPAKSLPQSSCPGILAALVALLCRAAGMSHEMLQVTSSQRGTGRRTPPQPALYSVGSARLRLGHGSA